MGLSDLPKKAGITGTKYSRIDQVESVEESL